MDVGIIGAGIAGLGAGIALARAGHKCTIFEKSSFKEEVGAAILISPNGNRILRRWDFDFDRAQPTDFKQFRIINASKCEPMLEHENIDFSGVEAQYGDKMCSYHRVDLHGGLRERAEALGVQIRLSSEVVAVDIETSEVDTRGGEKIRKDFWVVADGCHCPFLPTIAGEDIPSHKIGKSVYRWLAPMDQLMKHEQTRKIFEGQGAGFAMFMRPEKPPPGGFGTVTYPCRSGTLLNCAIFHDTAPDETHEDDWNAETTHEKVLKVLEGCADGVLNIPKTVDKLKVYTVAQRPPSSRIHRGNLLCIGDTTHHMLPTHAQGGCSALEDAAALEILFATKPVSYAPTTSPAAAASSTSVAVQQTLDVPLFTFSPEALKKRLALFQALRLPRSATTQILSSTHRDFTMHMLSSKTAEIRKFYDGELVDWPYTAKQWGKETRHFWYAYDVFREAGKAVVAVEGRDVGDEEGGLGGALYRVLKESGVRWFGDLSQLAEDS